MKGKIIVIEGSDGCGKETQSKLLQQHLEKNGIQSIVRSFPSYGKPQAGPVESYLHGELGDITDMTSQQISVLFLTDMFVSYKKEKWNDLLENGTWIIMDRYVESNMIYQASKSSSLEEAMHVIRYITYAGYEIFGLPKPDAVVYLDVSFETSQKLLNKRNSSSDIHESNDEYMKKVHQYGKKIAEMLEWDIISCDDVENKFIKRINEIQFDIFACLMTKFNGC